MSKNKSLFEQKGMEATWVKNNTQLALDFIKDYFKEDYSYLINKENFIPKIFPYFNKQKEISFSTEKPSIQTFSISPYPNLLKDFFKNLSNTLSNEEKVITYFRTFPRGYYFAHEEESPWSPPLVHLSLNYKEYTRTKKFIKNPFVPCSSFEELNKLLDFSNNLTNIIDQHKVFWLASVSATPLEALRMNWLEFKRNITSGKKTFESGAYHRAIQKAVEKKKPIVFSMMDYFVDFLLKKHYLNWFNKRITNQKGLYILRDINQEWKVGAPTDGIVKLVKTPWGATREMFFTHPQNEYLKIVEKAQNQM